MDNYTYIYRDEQGTPYYVGKGIKDRYLGRHRRIPIPPVAQIEMIEQPSPEAAYEHEKFLVKKYGRLDLGTGTLMNHTDGGAGTLNPCESARQKLRENGREAVKSGQLASIRTPEHQSKAGKIAGQITGPVLGRKMVESGQAFRVGKIQGQKNSESGHMASLGKIHGRKAVESGFLDSIRTSEGSRRGAKKACHTRWHVARGIISSTCSHCQNP
jgi:hypothetical protein